LESSPTPQPRNFPERRHPDGPITPELAPLPQGADRRRVPRGAIRETLRISFIDGIFTSGMLGLVDGYLIPYALALKASASQVANIGALPNLLAAFAQSQADLFKEWAGGRKRTLMGAVALQSVTLLGLPILPALPEANQLGALLSLAILYTVFGGLVGPLWGSLMCEYIPPRQRSSYFGWRNRLLGLVLISATLSAGFILQTSGSLGVRGFVYIFLIAGFFRLASLGCISRFYEPPEQPGIRRGIEYRASTRLNSNFRRFILFNGLMALSVNLVGPLFPVYLLQHLHFSYITYTLLVLASHATMFFTMARWGKKADAVGNLKIIRLAAWQFPLLPLLWLVSKNPAYLFLTQLAGGIAWAGYNLCITNFIYDAVPASQRVQATGVFNMVNGIALFAGAFVGGQLLGVLPPLAGSPFLMLALLSAALRGLVVMSMLPGVREVRHVRPESNVDVFVGVLRIQPVQVISRVVTRFLNARRAS
jgi:MFS family permease